MISQTVDNSELSINRVIDNSIDNSDILIIHRYLMVKNKIKSCSGLLNKIIDFPVELSYYPFMISLDKCNTS